MLLLRALASSLVAGSMMLLVIMQMDAAARVQWLTVEQILRNGKRGLSFDRHYAMPFDFAVISPFVGLVIFLCMPQWTMRHFFITGIGATILAIGLVTFWYKLPAKEAHNQSLRVAIYHGIFLAVGLWAILLVDAFTPNPEPVLLLVVCVILPAFLFLGTHMYLGLINWTGAASTFSGKPLDDRVGWALLVVATAAQCWRAFVLIPASFWDSLR
jgi:hypothetical protein